MRVVRVGAVAASIVILAIAAACGSFGAAPDSGDGGGGGGGDAASPDGATPEGSVPDAPADGMSVDAGSCSMAPAVSFLDEFSLDAGWDGSLWSTTSIGNLKVDSFDFKSPPSSLRLDVEASEPPVRWLARPLGFPCHLKASAQVVVRVAGTGDVDLFGVEDDDGANTRGVLLIRTGTSLKIEYPSGANIKTEILSATLGAFTNVDIDVDVATHQWSATVGAQTVNGPLPADWPKTKRLELRVGLLFRAAVTTPWAVRFDDVGVTP